MRIVAFVGSPVEHDEKEAVKVAKRLKKEKVNVDIVSFGEDVRILLKQKLDKILDNFFVFFLVLKNFYKIIKDNYVTSF